MNTRAVLLATVGLLGLGSVPAAHAATVSKAGGVITYQAAAGEENSPSVDRTLDELEFVITDATPGAGCTGSQYVPDTAWCSVAGVTQIRLLLGDMDDSVLIHGGVPAGVTTHVELGGFSEEVQSVTNDAPGPLEVIGGPGADSVTSNGDAEDTVVMGGGSDEVRTSGGDDTIDLGPDADLARGGGGADMIDGGDGSDEIYGDAGGDLVFGGIGDDQLWGELGSDIMYGEDGEDTLRGDSSFENGPFEADELHGGADWDTVDYGARGGTLPVIVSLDGIDNDGAQNEGDNVGPDGDIERVEGTGNPDVLIGNDADNDLYGDAGNDDLDGRGGDDWLDGFAGSDQLAGGDGSDLVEGSGEDDAILGEGGDDRLVGGTGDDTISGGDGADVIEGGLNNDMLLAKDGVADSIFCSAGTDTAEVDATDTFVDRLFCENVLGIDPPPGDDPGTGDPGTGGTTTGGTTTGGTTTVTPTGGTTPPPQPGLPVVTLAVGGTQRLATVRRRGVRVGTAAPGAGRVEATLLLSRRAAKRVRMAAAAPVVIGRKAVTVTGPRELGLRVKLTRKAKARIRRTIKPIVRVTFTDPSGARVSTSRRITLRR